MRAFGIASEATTTWRHADRRDGEDLALPLDLRDAVDAFVTLGTQWRWLAPAFGVPFRTGLDMAAVPATLRMLGTKPSRRLLADLKIMERAALDTWDRGR